MIKVIDRNCRMDGIGLPIVPEENMIVTLHHIPLGCPVSEVRLRECGAPYHNERTRLGLAVMQPGSNQ